MIISTTIGPQELSENVVFTVAGSISNGSYVPGLKLTGDNLSVTIGSGQPFNPDSDFSSLIQFSSTDYYSGLGWEFDKYLSSGRHLVYEWGSGTSNDGTILFNTNNINLTHNDKYDGSEYYYENCSFGIIGKDLNFGQIGGNVALGAGIKISGSFGEGAVGADGNIYFNGDYAGEISNSCESDFGTVFAVGAGSVINFSKNVSGNFTVDSTKLFSVGLIARDKIAIARDFTGTIHAEGKKGLGISTDWLAVNGNFGGNIETAANTVYCDKYDITEPSSYWSSVGIKAGNTEWSENDLINAANIKNKFMAGGISIGGDFTTSISTTSRGEGIGIITQNLIVNGNWDATITTSAGIGGGIGNERLGGHRSVLGIHDGDQAAYSGQGMVAVLWISTRAGTSE